MEVSTELSLVLTSTVNVIEDRQTNKYGYKDIIWQGICFPLRDENYKKDVEKDIVYGQYDKYLPSALNTSQNHEVTEKIHTKKEYDKEFNIDKRNKIIEKYYNLNVLKSTDDELFNLYRVGISYSESVLPTKLAPPISTDNPVLAVSIFKANISNTIETDWITKYLIPGLTQLIAYNCYFADGGIIVFIDYHTLENFKSLPQETLTIGSLADSYPSIYYENEDKENDVNKSLARFDEFIKDQQDKAPNPIVFGNAYEKFIYYYYYASKIYNSTDSDEVIINTNKAADLFVYHFDGIFTEINKCGFPCHITNGYIGQLIRYICLRQQNYEYTDNETTTTTTTTTTTKITRNKHYIWRDSHSNQTALNDALMIRSLNSSSKASTQKKYNLMPKNYKYSTDWHSYALCPADNTKYYRRTAIAGHVQMTNFTEDSMWLNDLDYLKFIGVAFIINSSSKEIPLKLNRPYQRQFATGIVFDFQYGLEEYLFINLYVMDIFKKYNIYYNDKFDYHLNLLHIEPNFITHEKKALWLLYIYLRDKLPEEFTMKDIITEIEKLRNDPPEVSNIRKWLSYLLAIYPTKYFIKSVIFSQSLYERTKKGESQEADIYEYKYKKTELNKQIETFTEEIYKKCIEEYTWELLNGIKLNCNTPIITSGIEWCTGPYMEEITKCPPENFFSGFYADSPASIDYGVFRNPEELVKVVENIDRKLDTGEQIPLYTNVINRITDTPTEFRGGSKDVYYKKYMKYKNKYLALKNK